MPFEKNSANTFKVIILIICVLAAIPLLAFNHGQLVDAFIFINNTSSYLTTNCQTNAAYEWNADSYPEVLSCKCLTGYKMVDGQCKDVDECEDNPCQNSGVCTNTKGSFSCECTDSYQGKTCRTDVNECDDNPCLHSGVCTNSVGDYSCACEAGHVGKTCQTASSE